MMEHKIIEPPLYRDTIGSVSDGKREGCFYLPDP
jgi:hypothetical protein